MSPNAAEIFAQVDAALLIAIIVEARLPAAQNESRAADAAWSTLYALGMFSVLLSLSVALTSVLYGRELPPVPTQVVTYATTMGAVALFYRTMSDLLPRARSHGFRFLLVLLIIAGGLIWYAIWLWSFAPESLWWNWS